VREIERYDAADAAVVSARVRKEAGRGEAVARLVAIYEEAREIHAAAGPADLTAVSRAGARAVARAHRKLRELEAHARAEAPERPGLRGVLTRLRSLARPRERRGRWQAP
jgi:hypothetical protein